MVSRASPFPATRAKGLIIRLVLAATLTGSPLARAKDLFPAADAPFATPAQVDLAAVLPPPPAAGSPEDKADLAAVLALQDNRNEATVRQARADRKQSVFRFADVIGPSFTRKRMPLTAAFFRRVTDDEEAILASVKDRWQRPRPFIASNDVTLCVKRPSTGSYPSSHAAVGYLYGLILSEMLPDRREALMARAGAYASSRSLCGAHYPSDIAAGRLAADAILAHFKQSAAFRAAFAQSQDEITQALSARR